MVVKHDLRPYADPIQSGNKLRVGTCTYLLFSFCAIEAQRPFSHVLFYSTVLYVGTPSGQVRLGIYFDE
jgi:hypothetical protein